MTKFKVLENITTNQINVYEVEAEDADKAMELIKFCPELFLKEEGEIEEESWFDFV